MRQELTENEIQQLAKHAGSLARDVFLLDRKRKEVNKEASKEIRSIKEELSIVHEWLRTGYKEIPQQDDMFPEEDNSPSGRLEQARRQVRKTQAAIRGEEFDDDLPEEDDMAD